MASRAKRIGYALEASVVNFWKSYGVPCKRVLGSGAFKNYSEELASDVDLNGYKIECKRRKNGTGFQTLYKWLDQDKSSSLLVLQSDRKPRLYVMKEDQFAHFAREMGWMDKPQNKKGD
jgi:hypothetical protein